MKFLVELYSSVGLVRRVTLDFETQQMAQTWGSKQAEILKVARPRICVTPITPEAIEVVVETQVDKVEEKKAGAGAKKKTMPRKKQPNKPLD